MRWYAYRYRLQRANRHQSSGPHVRLCMISVAIIEDNRLVRQGMVAMLGDLPDMCVVHAASRLEHGTLRAVRPDVILLDVGLQDQNCLRLATILQKEMAECKVIVMDLLPVHEEIAQFINAGVAGFILKDATAADFVGTLRSVAGGTRVLPPRMTSTLFSQIAEVAVGRNDAAVLALVRMTRREREVIGRISDGMSNKEIAQHLNVAPHTVKSHVRNVMEKLALHSRLQIAAYARKNPSEGSAVG